MTDRTTGRTAALTDAMSPSAATPSARRGLAAAVGAVGAAFFASLCCVGPLLFVTLGVGAGLASTFEPLRPVFTVLTVALLAVGFYVVYGKRPTVVDAAACAPDGTCAVPRSPRDRTRDKVLLWLATAVALVFLTFPQWSLILV
jgi:mercuric ion transport protein